MRIMWLLLNAPIRLSSCFLFLVHDNIEYISVTLLFGLFESINSGFSSTAITIYLHLKTKWMLSYTVEILMLLLVSFISRPFSFIYKFHFMFRHQNCIRINNDRNRIANSGNGIAIIVSNNNKIDTVHCAFETDERTNQVNYFLKEGIEKN